MATRPLRKRFLIVCEGEKTEPNYFRAFRVNADVRVEGLARSTIGLVKKTLSLRRREGPFDGVWAVFDKDSFGSDQFDRAIRLAEKEGIGAAWSNRCFELWYVLHFQYLDAALDCKELIRKLGQKLDGYEKNSLRLYEVLLPQQSEAIENARKLVALHGSKPPSRCDPCTRVHELVAELNRHLED